MRYAMLVKPHANVRYRQSLQKLALIELQCLLAAWGLEAEPQLTGIQGEPFLVFDTEYMTEECWRALSRHSAICFAAELRDRALVPLRRDRGEYLPDDLSQVLKYKGKTNADFTMMMLHCAKAASDFARSDAPLCVLDPLCGKATTLFCAMQEGDNAVGVELNAKALAETDAYFERFLKMHRLKHRRESGSQTMAGGGSARRITYTLADTPENMKQGDTRTLSLINGDATRLNSLLRQESCHLLVSDLPYGVQHAPREGKGISSLQKLVGALLRSCMPVLKRGGVVALAFNANTLRRPEVARAMREAGLSVLEDRPYNDFSHWVEQAVERDVIVARKA